MDRNTALAFAAGAVTGAAAIHVVLNVTRAKPARETSSFGSSSSEQASKAFVDDADEDADGVAELEQEQFSRNIAFLEDRGFERVRNTCYCGCSWRATCASLILIRSHCHVLRPHVRPLRLGRQPRARGQ